ALARAVHSDFAGLGERRRGLPLSGNKDVRWKWKEHELADVQALASSCLSALQEGFESSPIYLDPALLPNLLEEPLDASAEKVINLSCLAGRLISASIPSIPPEVFEFLEHSAGLNMESFRLLPGGTDLWRQLGPILHLLVSKSRPLGASGAKSIVR